MLIDYVVFLPLVTALALLIVPRTAAGALKGVALLGAAATFVLSLGLLTLGKGEILEQSVPWISGAWTAAYHVRADGLSLFFVLLTTLVSAVAIWAAFSYADEQRLRGFLCLLLIFET